MGDHNHRNEVRKAHYENMNWAHVAHDLVEGVVVLGVIALIFRAVGWI